jgi:hypothetical protein
MLASVAEVERDLLWDEKAVLEKAKASAVQ